MTEETPAELLLEASARIHMTGLPLLPRRGGVAQETGYKPRGLWYGFGDSWREWVQGNMPAWEKPHLYRVEVEPARILRLESAREVEEFSERYACPLPGTEGMRSVYFSCDAVDWAAVAARYGGIEIPDYHWGLRHSLMWYYGWDVASGCVWAPDALRETVRLT
jgi:hypothetical protein